MIVENGSVSLTGLITSTQATLSCPLEGTINIAEIKKISVERVMEEEPVDHW